MSDREIEFTATIAVLLCWLGFLLAFVFRKRQSGGKVTSVDPVARIGIIIQAVGYAIVWSYRREQYSSLLPFPGNLILALVSSLIAGCSVWMVMSAIRTLGKQWALAARLLDEHQLITSGPFAIVRHPIYAGMFGLLIATGICYSNLTGLLVGIAVYLVGFYIRAGREESILLGRFGDSFIRYCESTPMLIPRIMRRK